jgi:hypothetical protein
VRADGFEGSDGEFTNIRAAASKKKGLRVSRLAGKVLANVPRSTGAGVSQRWGEWGRGEGEGT